MKTIIEEFPETLPANSVPRQVNRTGEFIIITEADWPIEMNVPGMTGGWIRCELGFEYRMMAGEAFPVAYFRNPEAKACGMRAIVGFGSVVDRRLNVVSTRPNQFVQFADAITVAVPTAKSLTPGDPWLFSGVALDNDDLGQRKHLIITNPDAAIALEILSGTVVCGLVQPKHSVVLETADAFTVRNPTGSGGTVIFYALETFYYARG